MQIEYLTTSGSASGAPSDVSAIFLRGKQDWFSQYLSPRQTRYEGWFMTDGSTEPNRYYKTFERILPENPEKVILSGQSSRFFYGDGNEATLTMMQGAERGGGGLQISATQAITLDLNLDMRGMYLQPDQGRNYEVHQREDGLLVSYTDPTLEGKSLYLHLRFSGSLATKSEWYPATYPRDAARNSGPSNLYCYYLGQLTTEKLSAGCGFDLDVATANSAAAWAISQADFSPREAVSPIGVARELAAKALQELHVPAGYYAGLPWFHQLWSRDELISGLGLPREEQLAMIERYLAFELANGELPTFAASGTTCADGVGWLALLVREYGINELPAATRIKLTEFLQQALTGLNTARRMPSGLIWSGHNATWMDTIGRIGCRVEIQCMYALVLELLAQLTTESHYLKDQIQVLETIRHHLYHDGFLADGLDEQLNLDRTKRPNIFMAYLIQPDLLNHEEWVRCFNQILEATQLSWGGLSSIDTHDTRFSGTSTGENNISYHNGDSWFFVNNLAALALLRLDSIYFKETAARLLHSSMEEILWQGFLGHAAEIAAAFGGAAWGCGTQAWSASSYVLASANLSE